ncbi:hypothetical protein [Agreia sp. VKM Ac-1783]|uniref:hypothetical protein n=1 Tax=Agreia sp. VKM Ac-1783 TaxID=1938889 RepID=UPI000A2AB36D|nr:hypothetical protein [Agreia sp. VKM Ac-1783]SMQ75494.1 hypothetical protein SAMN06295943_3633 [Agreia sp. VKM Ac-1783]
MNRSWTNVIVAASMTGGGAALGFFVAANVHAAVLTSGDLSFWGFVIMLAAMGSIGAFVLCFVIAVVAGLFTRRLPASISDKTRLWSGGVFIAVAALGLTLLGVTALSGFWMLWPTFASASIAAGLSFVFSGRVSRRGGRDPGLARTPPF